MNESVRTVLGGEIELRACEGYLRVWHGRSARNLAEAEEVIAAIEAELARTGLRDLMFDSRDSDRTSEEVQARLWNWLQGAKLRRVATLMRSELLGVSVSMQGLSKSVRLRAFDNESAARAWLTAR